MERIYKVNEVEFILLVIIVYLHLPDNKQGPR